MNGPLRVCPSWLPPVPLGMCTWAVRRPGPRPQSRRAREHGGSAAPSTETQLSHLVFRTCAPLSATFPRTAISQSRQLGKAKGIEPCKELISKIKSLKILRWSLLPWLPSRGESQQNDQCLISQVKEAARSPFLSESIKYKILPSGYFLCLAVCRQTVLFWDGGTWQQPVFTS